MHFSTLFISLGALAATSMATPAPALPVPAAMANPMNDGPLSGTLPKNLAKIWIFSNLNCDQNDGPAFNIYVLPGEDRCIPYQNVGSIVAWYKSEIGKCTTTIHSGSDCRGIAWKPFNKKCTRQLFASLKVSCPKL